MQAAALQAQMATNPDEALGGLHAAMQAQQAAKVRFMTQSARVCCGVVRLFGCEVRWTTGGTLDTDAPRLAIHCALDSAFRLLVGGCTYACIVSLMITLCP